MHALLAQTDTPPSASPADWAWVFGILVAGILLYQLLRGWRSGLFRQLASGAVLLITVLGAWQSAPLLGNMLASELHYPRLLLNVLAGASVGLCIFIFGHLIADTWIPQTRDFKSLQARRTVGLSGMAVGGVIGSFYIVGLLALINIAGAFSEIWIRAHEPKSTLMRYTYAQNGTLPKTPPEPEQKNLASALVKLRNHLGDYGLRPLMETADPMPDALYRTLHKMNRVAQNDVALEVFSNHPLSQKLLHEPSFQALRSDPEVTRLAQARDLHALMQHPKVIVALNDPHLLNMAMQYDIEQALDDALAYSAR